MKFRCFMWCYYRSCSLGVLNEKKGVLRRIFCEIWGDCLVLVVEEVDNMVDVSRGSFKVFRGKFFSRK